MNPKDKLHDEILTGLKAARDYEKNRPKLAREVQEELMDANFPRLPRGDAAAASARELTRDDRERLRASLRDAADEATARSIANLREQLTEYHSLLERLTSTTRRYEVLEDEFRARGRRVEELEREVAALRNGGEVWGARTGLARRVSSSGDLGLPRDGFRRGAPPGRRAAVQIKPIVKSGPIAPPSNDSALLKTNQTLGIHVLKHPSRTDCFDANDALHGEWTVTPAPVASSLPDDGDSDNRVSRHSSLQELDFVDDLDNIFDDDTHESNAGLSNIRPKRALCTESGITLNGIETRHQHDTSKRPRFQDKAIWHPYLAPESRCDDMP